jgi:hypothetical protein
VKRDPKVPRAHPQKVVAKLGWQYTLDQSLEEAKGGNNGLAHRVGYRKEK